MSGDLMADANVNPWTTLLEQGAVDAAARVLAAQIASPEAWLEELKRAVDDCFAAPRRQQAAKLVSLLGAFSELAFIAINGLAWMAHEDELDTLRYCADTAHAWRDENEPTNTA